MGGIITFIIIVLILYIIECIIFYRQRTYHTLTYNQKATFWSIIGVQTVLSVGITVALIFG